MTTPSQASPWDVFHKIVTNIERVMRGQSAAIRKLMAAFASGHSPVVASAPGEQRVAADSIRLRTRS